MFSLSFWLSYHSKSHRTLILRILSAKAEFELLSNFSLRHDIKKNNQFLLWLGIVDKLTEEYHAKTAEIVTMLTETAWQEIIQLFVVLVYRKGDEIRGPFLEGLERFLQIAESRSKVLWWQSFFIPIFFIQTEVLLIQEVSGKITFQILDKD